MNALSEAGISVLAGHPSYLRVSQRARLEGALEGAEVAAVDKPAMRALTDEQEAALPWQPCPQLLEPGWYRVRSSVDNHVRLVVQAEA